ncbi:MAG TPA: thiamine phosphate synthase [Candidatus Kapabacteria bacterium]|nr:thiamine phosphate synthase [Candidatus Kapabacteria bacterium]
MKPLSDGALYTFIDSAYLHGRDVIDLARSLCEGGSDLIQLRAKDWSLEKIEAAAGRILPITRDYGVPLVINDHLNLAERVGADICHLGQEDFFDAGNEHISQLNTRVLVGLSTHAPEQAQRAVGAGAHYVAIGPIYPTGTKPTAKPVTLDYVRWAATNVQIPWFAIGGVNLETIDAVLAAGARRVCVVSAILNAPDAATACREFKRRLQ